MAQRVNMDAMIRREDFGRETGNESTQEMIRELNISLLMPDALIRKSLRKPDFQRETNHWSPPQVVKFLTSFVDGAVIPSIILWRSTNFIFVIDGSHRLSALCAWISDDYGDRNISNAFYDGEISAEQKRIANRTRNLINNSIGSFESLVGLVGTPSQGPAAARAAALATRPIFLQQVVGTPKVAEDSFFAINTQGTALDETETFLIRNRRKPVAIGARAIVRAGVGHAYWSTFSQQNQREVIRLSAALHKIMFEPEATTPLKTLDLPLGGSASPVDALAVLIDFLSVSNSKSADKIETPSRYSDDETGDQTISMLKNGLKIANRLTGNSPESLGLHPAVYFNNEKGKHNRFLFLGISSVITNKLLNNDANWFKKFIRGRKAIEDFLLLYKPLIAAVLQGLSKKQRIPKMRDLFEFLSMEAAAGKELQPQTALEQIGVSGRTYEVTVGTGDTSFSNETKSQVFYKQAISKALVCPICSGLLDVTKSVSYDHIIPVRSTGLGTPENGQMVHPYCNSIKS